MADAVTFSGAGRALPVLDVMPAGHFGLVVADAAWAPHLRAGELAVVDTTDTEPQTGELFVLVLAGRAGSRLALVQPCRSALADEQSVAFGFGFGRPGAPGLVDGPLSLDGWAAKCRGRVVGVMVPASAASRAGEGANVARATSRARPAGRVTRIPTVTLQPNNYRPSREAPRRGPEDEEIKARFEHAIFSFHVAYEIQAACGLVPLTPHEIGQRRAQRDLAHKGKDTPLRTSLQAAAEKLIRRRACSHCMARSECPHRGRA